jgi:citrate lyase subunit beta/citryl-CoA lyase
MRYTEALAGAASSVRLWAMLETARCMFRLEEIAASAATSRLSGLVVGTNDLAKDMGALLTASRIPFLPVLSLALAAARAFGLVALDGVYNGLDDDAGFVEQCRQGAEFGFDGKTLIHPRQIDPCNTVFSPTPEQLVWARIVVDAFDRPENAGKGAIRADGMMVERLHLVQAQHLLATQHAIRREGG